MPQSNKNVPNATSLGERLRWLRELKGFTLKEFAARIDCDPGYLSKLENGKADNPSSRFMARVCTTFWVAPNWLGSGIGDPFWNSNTGQPGKTPLPEQQEKRFQRVFSVLDDLPDALAASLILGHILQDKSLTELQQIWSEVRSIHDLPTPAILFWNEIFMRCQFPKLNISSKSDLTNSSLKGNHADVKSERSEIEKLIEDVKRKAERPGARAELARELDVAPARISEWLSGKKEPGGDYALRLRNWVYPPKHQ